MTDTFHQAWNRFTACLAERAPSSYRSLRPAATSAQLAALETQLGYALHPALRALLELHDGTSSTLPGLFLPLSHRLCTVRDMAGMHDMLVDYEQENRDEGVWEDEDDVMGHPHQWVPFAQSIDGGFAFVDHRPGPGYGTVHEFGMGSGASETSIWAAGLTELFGMLAESVHSGRPFGSFWPVPEETQAGERRLGWDVRL